MTTADGNTHTVLDTSNTSAWTASVGPVTWDHFFHGETYDAKGWPASISTSDDIGRTNAGSTAVVMAPPASFPTGMGVKDASGKNYVALGRLEPVQAPPLRIRKEVSLLLCTPMCVACVRASISFQTLKLTLQLTSSCLACATFHHHSTSTHTFVSAFSGLCKVSAMSVSSVEATDIGQKVLIFDFGENAAGTTRLHLPAGHNIPAGSWCLPPGCAAPAPRMYSGGLIRMRLSINSHDALLINVWTTPVLHS